MQNFILNITFLFFMLLNSTTMQAQYTMPIETEEHEGTWLQWPHNYLYGPFYRDDLETTFVEMTRELVKGENVHIVAYNNNERNYITQTLNNAGVDMVHVDFVIRPNDDCWVRDNGPIFVYDENNELTVLDWGFNGWGGDTPYELCNTVPVAVADELGLPSVDLNNVVIEGGAFEIDGNGTFLATKSSILGTDRNPDLTQAEIEEYLTDYIGVTNFIWLEGVHGLEITDMHIDGFARFHDAETIVTMNEADLTYWEIPGTDQDILLSAVNIDGTPYNHVYLPLTQNNVVTTWGENLNIKGSYVNYYTANAVVLVPAYNDPNDAVAISILENLYPDKEVVGIEVRNLYYGGGMIHCVTQQQPMASPVLSVKMIDFETEDSACDITLKWTTATEINHDKFIIERSADNKNFYAIGEIKGQGNSNNSIHYTFIDEQPLTENYYRLHQVDEDGEVTLSSMIVARQNCDSDLSVKLMPTVTSDFSTLQIKGKINEDLEVQILSVTGKVVRSFQYEVRQGLEIPLDVSDLSEGLYYVWVRAEYGLFGQSAVLVVAR